MLILRNLYGNDGRMFWWALLETLGNTEGHCYDCSDDLNWQFLAAEAGVSPEQAERIMQTIAALESIDPLLWKKARKVWCQNFVDGIAQFYRNRCDMVPVKPEIPGKKKSQQGADDYGPLFELFWETWPRKVSKQEAMKAFIALKPDKTMTDEIVGNAEFQVKAGMLDLREKMRFCPHPATWLKGRRWEDSTEMMSAQKEHEKAASGKNEKIAAAIKERDAYTKALADENPQRTLWFDENIKAPLRDEMNEHSYKAFIAVLIPVSITQEKAFLYMPEPGFLSWVQDHYRERIEELFRGIGGFSRCKVEFTSTIPEKTPA